MKPRGDGAVHAAAQVAEELAALDVMVACCSTLLIRSSIRCVSFSSPPSLVHHLTLQPSSPTSPSVPT